MGFSCLAYICQATNKTIGEIPTVNFYLVVTLVFVTRSQINQVEKSDAVLHCKKDVFHVCLLYIPGQLALTHFN